MIREFKAILGYLRYIARPYLFFKKEEKRGGRRGRGEKKRHSKEMIRLAKMPGQFHAATLTNMSQCPVDILSRAVLPGPDSFLKPFFLKPSA